MEKIYCQSLEYIHEAAKKIVEFSGDEKIWIFEGDLGVGKTTLIKAIAGIFGIGDRVSSPTFSLVNEYGNDTGALFYHFDFYRVEDPAEVLDIGAEEYFYSGRHCWIEWAERIPGFVPPDHIRIKIEMETDGARIITLKRIIHGKAIG